MQELIREIRESKQMSQSEFAQAIGVTQATISMIESGERMPGRKTLAGLFSIANNRHKQQIEDAILEAAGIRVLHPTKVKES